MELANKIINISFDELYNNCIYSSIAHAILVLKDPFFAYVQSWDGYNYCFHYGHTRGTISFYEDRQIAVGAARDECSIRRKWYPYFDAIDFFDCASDNIRSCAGTDALEYLYDEEEDIIKPMASVGFWLKNGSIYSKDNIVEFKENGGEYIYIIASNTLGLKKYWKEEYWLDNSEMEIIDYIFYCVRNKLPITNKNVNKVINCQYEGYNECLESLKEIGVNVS